MHTTQGSGEPPGAARRAAAAALRAGVGALGALPVGAAYALADVASLGILAWSWAHERGVAARGRGLRHNQRIVFREALGPEGARRLRRSWARHLARLAADCARLQRLSTSQLARAVDLEAVDSLRPLIAEGRGLIAVSGHIGVWELLVHLPRLTGIPLTVVARPRAHPAAEAVLREARLRGGASVTAQRAAFWRLRSALRRGGVVGLLADENARERPVFAPFLGTAAATSRMPATLQRLSGAPIAVLCCHRTGRGRFDIRVWDVIRAARGDGSEADAERVTRAVNDALSRAILARPEQWLWSSRRFLTRPTDEVPGADGLPPRVRADLDVAATQARPRPRASRTQARSSLRARSRAARGSTP